MITVKIPTSIYDNSHILDSEKRRSYIAETIHVFLSIEGMEIHRTEKGQPYIIYPKGCKESPPSISISHSGKWGIYVLADPGCFIGMDVEDMAKRRDFRKLAAYAYSIEEQEYVDVEGKVGFYRLWTAKEAIAKSTGQGLAAALQIDLGLQLCDKALGVYFNVQVLGATYCLYQQVDANGLLYTIAQKVEGSQKVDYNIQDLTYFNSFA